MSCATNRSSTLCRSKSLLLLELLPCLALPLSVLSQPTNHTVVYRHFPHRRSSRQIFLFVTSGLGKQRGDYFELSNGPGSRTTINWLFSALACRQTCRQLWDRQFRPGINWQTSSNKSLATFGGNATSHSIRSSSSSAIKIMAKRLIIFTLCYENWLLTRTCVGPVSTID